MDVWIVDSINLKTKKGFMVGVVFDEEVAKLIKQQSNEETIYAYHHETICGKLFACDKDSWMGGKRKETYNAYIPETSIDR